jgi:hypothetical protein
VHDDFIFPVVEQPEARRARLKAAAARAGIGKRFFEMMGIFMVGK